MCNQPLASSVAGSLWDVFEEVITRSHEPFNLARRKLSGLCKRPRRAPGAKEPPPNGGCVKMHTRSLIAADDDDRMLGEIMLSNQRAPLKGVDNVASRRQCNIGVTALRVLTLVCLTAPLHNFAVAVSDRNKPKRVIDPARIKFVVNPDI